MPHHMHVANQSCVFCRHRLKYSPSRAKMIAVLGTGSNYRGCSLPFYHVEQLSSRGFRRPHPVYYDGRREFWQSCSDYRCSSPQKSAKVFLLHIDCLKLVQRCVSTETLKLAWLLGLWCCPWPGYYYDPPKPSLWLDSLAKYMNHTESTKDSRSLVENIARLPPEIGAAIVALSSDSSLWRFAMVLAWQPSILDSVRNGAIKTLPLRTLDCWTRGKPRHKDDGHQETATPSTQQPKQFFRMGLDWLGIRSIQLLESRSDPVDAIFPSCPWYIVEEITRLDGFDIESNGYFLRLESGQNQDSNFTLWDTPFAPDLNSCRIVDNITSQSQPRRLRCITLDDKLSGLSAFHLLGRTGRIYAYTPAHSSAVEDYWKHGPENRNDLVWLHFPLAAGEKIQDVWIRQKKIPELEGWAESNTLVARTSRSRVFAFGPDIDQDDDSYELCKLNDGPISQLFHEDPDPRCPIRYFGAACQPGRSSSQLNPLKRVEFPHTRTYYRRTHRGWLFYSSAALEDVKHVRLFHDDLRLDEEDRLEYERCTGILLTYYDGSQEALGQCRIGASASTEVLQPTAIYLKEPLLKRKTWRAVSIRFSSRNSNFETSDMFGWHCIRMAGELEWWFNDSDAFLKLKPAKGRPKLDS